MSAHLPGGHLFVAGGADQLNRATAALVGHMHGFKLFGPRLSAGYALKGFAQDLKQAMSHVVLEAEPALFLVEDFQLLDEAFLQYLNQLLATGSVPGLYSQQEFEQMSGQLRELASADDYHGELAAYFANSECGRGGQCAQRSRACCTWYWCWTRSTPTSAAGFRPTRRCTRTAPCFGDRLPPLTRSGRCVGCEVRTALQTAQLVLDSAQLSARFELPDLLCQLYGAAPDSVRNPPKFAVFLRNFQHIHADKTRTVRERFDRLKAGVDKLNETREQVARMQRKAAEKSRTLAEKQQAADRALAQITQSMTVGAGPGGADARRAGRQGAARRDGRAAPGHGAGGRAPGGAEAADRGAASRGGAPAGGGCLTDLPDPPLRAPAKP